MRVLIVSCTPNTSEAYFTEIATSIVKVMNTQTVVSDTQLVVIHRNAKNLTDYLYELDTSHIIPNAIHNFQAIDLFFVVGNRNVHPWHQAMWNINCLIRMCLRLNRHLLLISGCAFQSLVFQLSCGFIGNISLMNTNNESSEMRENGKPAKKTDLFLDQAQGILYGYNFENNEWFKKRDCGLQNHHRKEQASRKSRYLMLRQNPSALLVNRNIEEECSVETDHRLFANVSSPFRVEYISNWRANPASCNFKVLAKTNLGPSVIEFQNVVSVQFRVGNKYPSTVRILQNFILEKLQSLFVGAQQGTRLVTNREEYDKPSLSIPLRKIDTREASLPLIQMSQQRKRQINNLKMGTEHKTPDCKSNSTLQRQHTSKTQDWWKGPRVNVPSRKPLFISKFQRVEKQQHTLRSTSNFRTLQKPAKSVSVFKTIMRNPYITPGLEYENKIHDQFTRLPSYTKL